MVAVVIGLDKETTLQFEGKAVELTVDKDNALKEIYFDVFKDGRERAEIWPGLVHFKIVPTWLNYCNFNMPAVVEEMSGAF